MRSYRDALIIALGTILALAFSASAWAKGGRLEVRARPSTAYVFVDGTPIGHSQLSLWLHIVLKDVAPGDHTVTLYNYGYKTEEHKVSVAEGKRTILKVAMTPVPGDVSGPFGRIQLEGPGNDMVLLNGKTPEYFVGHVDEFNNQIIWRQELLVPPGTHQITVIEGGTGKTIYSGSVNVEANKRVIVYLKKNGETKVTEWKPATAANEVPRFVAGLASARVAVAKPSAQLSAAGPGGQALAGSSQLNCGESAQLRWTTADATVVEISELGKVAASGEQSVSPKQTTTYKLAASGPGGTADSSATVNVNTGVQANLSVSPNEVRYMRKGDQVTEQGSATLNWSAANASTVSIDPLGSVGPSGSQTVKLAPKKTEPGPVDETVRYTLTASNPCGGSESRTAMLHITGTIEPAIDMAAVQQLETRLALHSVYFPTAQPTVQNPTGGLLESQQQVLASLAEDFKKYVAIKPEAHLILGAHADRRGSKEYNEALSERRVERAKSFLVEHGVPNSSIETKAFGSQDNLTADQVKKLVSENPDLNTADRKKMLSNLGTIVLAQNRRVDVTLSTTGQQSTRIYPFNAADALTLLSTQSGAKAAKPAAKKEKKK